MYYQNNQSPIFKRRIELGLSQAELAERADTDRWYIGKLESGYRPQRRSRAFLRVAAALGVEVRDLLEEPKPDVIDAIAPVFGIDATELREGNTKRARHVKEQLRVLRDEVQKYEDSPNTVLAVDPEQLAAAADRGSDG